MSVRLGLCTRVAGGLALGLVLALPAAAADSNFSWSGWYLMGTAGWGWRAHNAYPPNSYYTSLGANFSGGGGYGGSSGGGVARHNGAEASFGLGYNYQFGKFVLGAEYEFMYADLQTDPTHAKTEFTQGAGPYPTAFIVSNYDTVNGDANRWYGIARARLGFSVLDRGLIYFAAGPAYRLSYAKQDPVVTTIPYLSPTTTVTLAGFNKTHAWGLAIGTGFEYAAWDNWFIRGEWMHLDFGHDTYIDPVATALIGKPALLSFKRNSDIARVGMVYRFYGGNY